MKNCQLCPRRCGVDRTAGERGACNMPAEVFVARAAPHFFEEPPISGEKGSGTVFFSGCSLGCIFCQNRKISHAPAPMGQPFSEQALAALFLELGNSGVHNLNLVTPTHYAAPVARALAAVKKDLRVPVVYNTSGYELPETLARFDGLVDVYLPDFKYASASLAGAYSAAPDYPEVALAAIKEMHRQVGAVRIENGILQKGVVLRHLVLPGAREDSIRALRLLAKSLPVEEILLSLMWQYTPDFLSDDAPKRLRRRVTTFEYRSVAEVALALGFEGFFQERAAASAAYTPPFET